MNCDGLIGLSDAASIVDILLNPTANPLDIAAAALNTDGLDIQTFVDQILLP